jgi:hypothetical protein
MEREGELAMVTGSLTIRWLSTIFNMLVMEKRRTRSDLQQSLTALRR